MRIIKLNTNPNIYSSNVYLVLGDWGTLDDQNVLVDAGVDDHVLKSIQEIYTGVGKRPVNKIFITHQHFDHIGGIFAIKERYKAEVWAFNSGRNITHTFNDQHQVKMGDSIFTVYHMPGHSADSVAFYNFEHKILFSGDTNFDLRKGDISYSDTFMNNYLSIKKKGVKIIYPGHGKIISNNVQQFLDDSTRRINENQMITNSII